MAEKMRVHILAKELSVPSKVIIEKCKAEGITSVKNHMSTLSAGLHATICEWFSDGLHDTTIETSSRVNIEKVRIKRKKKKVGSSTVQEKKKAAAVAGDRAVAAGAADAAMLVAEPPIDEPPPAELPTAEPIAVDEAPPDAASVQAPETVSPGTMVSPDSDAPPGAEEAASTLDAVVAEVSVDGGDASSSPTSVDESLVKSPDTKTEKEEGEAAAEDAKPITPAGPQNVPAKAKLQGPRVVRYEAPDYDLRMGRRASADARRGNLGPVRDSTTRDPGSRGQGGAPAPPGGAPEKGVGRRKGRLSPRRGSGQVAEVGKKWSEWRDRDLQERRARLAGATGRRIHRRRAGQGGPMQPVTTGPKTEATVHEPVRMKEFCAATGLNFIQCFKVLKTEHNIVANVNMAMETETAEMLALQFGIELTVIPSKTRLDELEEEFARRERKALCPRPPVVTMLGHVDHGKTSLLDAIRRTRMVAKEDGGITQHIGASHIKTESGAVTFLDTPGHEAFTAMRARGANLTDVVVLVVAADDGVMPQTVEAINHAKAAGVPVVVALNKIDLGEQNRLKIYGQLAEHELTPSGEWGGDTDVIATSATTGVGIDKLIEHLADLSAVLELKADPTLPASGTVIEAETKSGVGAVIRLLVQEGTLRIGDFVVCGPAFGKVRALLNDRGERIQEALPAFPVELWGLDGVPAAGDKLYTVESLSRAKDIASEMKQTRIESARVHSRRVKTLEEMFERRDTEEVPELNIIIKTDVDGSAVALRQALSRPLTDEVRLTIRHSGVGTVTDSDVLLAAACDAIIIAFRVEPSAAVRRLAEQHGVDIRSYRVIYDVCDELKKAVEGLLAPEERIERRARVEVRQLFRLSRKGGVIAGSYVQDGVVNRNHFAKVLRDDVVVRDGCRFASVRRFKEDAKEVRAGLECGLRLEGFDDIHAGDIIETYEVVKVARTLS